MLPSESSSSGLRQWREWQFPTAADIMTGRPDWPPATNSGAAPPPVQHAPSWLADRLPQAAERQQGWRPPWRSAAAASSPAAGRALPSRGVSRCGARQGAGVQGALAGAAPRRRALPRPGAALTPWHRYKAVAARQRMAAWRGGEGGGGVPLACGGVCPSPRAAGLTLSARCAIPCCRWQRHADSLCGQPSW